MEDGMDEGDGKGTRPGGRKWLRGKRQCGKWMWMDGKRARKCTRVDWGMGKSTAMAERRNEVRKLEREEEYGQGHGQMEMEAM
jgi:hypothetical protein